MRTLKNGFTLIELMIVVAIIGILSATAIPAFLRYVKKSKTSEAMLLLATMSTSAVVYFEGEHSTRGVNDNAMPKQFPSYPGSAASTQLVTFPSGSVCKCGAKCDPEITAPYFAQGNQTPLWAALNLPPSDPFYTRVFRYSYAGTGLTASFTAMTGLDLDCDDVTSTFERAATVDANYQPRLSSAIYSNNETE